MVRPYACVVVLCLAACASPKQQCTINSDCHGGAYCVSGTCVVDCRADYDCARGVCLTAIGKCVDGAADSGVPAIDMAVANMNGPRDFAVEQNAPADLSVVPHVPAPYGDVCQQNADCASNLCSKNPFQTGDHECTGACNKGCMLGDFCVGGVACAQSDIGASCAPAQGGADCRAGACLGGGGGPAVCTKRCTSAVECPAGYSCSSVMGVRVCVPVDATQSCFRDADCWFGTQCDILNARCLADCRSAADCPLWHQCVSGWCTPNKALGRGGIGDRCKSGDDCRAGFCAGGTCPGACGITADKGQYCTGGWGCNPIDTGQGFTLGCLLAGVGSLGDPCNPQSGNTDCASGLCITDNNNDSYCTRFCNAAPCPSSLPKCASIGIKADGITPMACTR